MLTVFIFSAYWQIFGEFEVLDEIPFAIILFFENYEISDYTWFLFS